MSTLLQRIKEGYLLEKRRTEFVRECWETIDPTRILHNPNMLKRLEELLDAPQEGFLFGVGEFCYFLLHSPGFLADYALRRDALDFNDLVKEAYRQRVAELEAAVKLRENGFMRP